MFLSYSSLHATIFIAEFIAFTATCEINSKLQICERYFASNKRVRNLKGNQLPVLLATLSQIPVTEKKLLFTIRNLVHFTIRNLVPFTKRFLKKYLSFFLLGFKTKIQKKFYQQTSSQKLVDQKINGLQFFWEQDWEHVSVFRLDKEVRESSVY